MGSRRLGARGLAAVVVAFLAGPSAPARAIAARPPAGIITTLAGSNHDGRPAAELPLQLVRGMATDAAGNLYFSEGYAYVRKVSTSGILSTLAGNGINRYRGDGGPASLAELVNPSGVAVDKAGNVLIATEDHRIRRVSTAGIITTVAGTGSPGFSGDGGAATAARLYSPAGLTSDPAGDLFITDTGNQRLREVDASGIITTIGGNGTVGSIDDGAVATDGPLFAGAFGADAAGNVYVADAIRHSIRKISSSGVISTIAGNGTYGFGGDGGPALDAAMTPLSAALDAAGNLFIADGVNNRIRKVDNAGIITTVAGDGTTGVAGDGGPAIAAQLNRPNLIAVDGAGNLFVYDDSGRIRRIDRSGTITSFVGGSPRVDRGDGGPAVEAVVRPSALAVDAQDNVYIAEAEYARVRKVSPTGTITAFAGTGVAGFSGDGGPALDAQLSGPAGLAIDPAGDVYVSDAGNSRIRRISPTGIITTIAGTGQPGFSGDGQPATAATFYGPSSLALDQAGNLFVSDTRNQRVRRIDPSGIVTTVAGTGAQGFVVEGVPALQATFQYPFGLAVDRHGDLLIVDSGNRRVRRLSQGVLTTVAGTADQDPRRGLNGEGPPPGDGGLATVTTLDAPAGIAVDADGNLFVAEQLGATIRKVTPAGVISTVAGSGLEGFAGDGGPALAAQMFSPAALALDHSGNLLIAEGGDDTVGGNRVRRVSGLGAVDPAVGPAAGWGWNVFGQLGNGNTTDRSVPTGITGATGTRTVSSGAYHGLALSDDGNVTAWGWNGVGEVGDGTTTDRATPARVVGLSDVTAVSAGAYHSLALRADGTVWAWGWNAFGQVGDGTATDRHAPVKVAGLSNVVAVAAGSYHSLALRADGTVWAWGWNGVGQLGNGTVDNALTPRQVTGLQGVVGIAGAYAHSLAVLSDGTMRAWGWNVTGQLGDGTVVDRHTPVPVLGVTGAVGAAGGALHSLALRADGNVYAWGWNAYGQLGTGTTVDQHVAVRVPGLTGVASIAAGWYHSVAMSSAGGVSTWGWNGVGQLGTGSATGSKVPVPVPTLTGAVAVSANTAQTLAVRRNG